MKLLIAILSLTALVAHAKVKTFDLAGIDQDGNVCSLFIDSYGYDREIVGKDKFFAQVRTSFAPDVQITIVPNPKNTGDMMSVDENGRPTGQLSLRGPRLERGLKALLHAKSYMTGTPRAEHCVNLRPIRNR